MILPSSKSGRRSLALLLFKHRDLKKKIINGMLLPQTAEPESLDWSRFTQIVYVVKEQFGEIY